MYKKIAKISILSLVVSIAGGLWGVEQYLDYAPGINPSPLIQKNLASSALGQITTKSIEWKEYYEKNAQEIDADIPIIQEKVMKIWQVRYPLVAEFCDLSKIQASFAGNEKIDRTICDNSKIAGVVGNRFLDTFFEYPDNREVMGEILAMKWALASDSSSEPTLQAFWDDMRTYQLYLDDFITNRYTELQKRKEGSDMESGLVRGKFLGLEMAFLFAEQEKVIVDYILGE